MRALVVQGGGTRAAYASGVLAALQEADERGFDAVYGTSAGGVLGTWFIAGQAQEAADGWGWIRDKRYLSYRRRMARRGPAFNHTDLFEKHYRDEMPLDVDRVRMASIPCVVTATNADTGEPRHVDIRGGPVMPWLMATSRLPLGAGPAVEVDGGRWVDGGLSDPVPLQRALDDGATEVILVLNRPRGVRTPESRLVVWLVTRRYPPLRDNFLHHHRAHNKAMALAESPPPGVTVHIIRPQFRHGVGRMTRDLARIEGLVHTGRRHGREYLARQLA